MDGAGFLLSKTYSRPRLTCVELSLFLHSTGVDYGCLIEHFQVGPNLAEPRKFCLGQTAFALIVFTMNGIQNRNPGAAIEPLISHDETYPIRSLFTL
jgi:hypothetical protein